jgi:hypothetical protein
VLEKYSTSSKNTYLKDLSKGVFLLFMHPFGPLKLPIALPFLLPLPLPLMLNQTQLSGTKLKMVKTLY